jgi:hypothetical protein
MKRAEDIERIFRKAALGLDPNADERIFADVLQARRRTIQNPITVFDRWRTIMRSPLTKIAVAAAVVVACAIGLSVWRTTGSSIVLADVVANMEKAKAERQTSTLRIWNQRMTGEDTNKRHDYRESRDTSLMSQVYGTKSSAEELDPNSGETTIHETFFQAPKHTLIHVYPGHKKYYRIEYDDGWDEQWQGSAEEFVKKFLACKCESLGRSIIDGVEVEGFRSTDPKLGDGAYRGESKIQFDYKL